MAPEDGGYTSRRRLLVGGTLAAAAVAASPIVASASALRQTATDPSTFWALASMVESEC